MAVVAAEVEWHIACPPRTHAARKVCVYERPRENIQSMRRTQRMQRMQRAAAPAPEWAYCKRAFPH